MQQKNNFYPVKSSKAGVLTKTKQFNGVNIVTLASNDACFDLQFRKDTRRERTNAPTYYRWKAQFVITGPKEASKVMAKIKRHLGCGNVSITKNQARFSVQNIDHLKDVVVPFFKKNPLLGSKKKEFELWQKAVNIIYENKGKYITKWKKNDLLSLVHIHKSSAKYKQKPRQSKWMAMAEAIIKTS